MAGHPCHQPLHDQHPEPPRQRGEGAFEHFRQPTRPHRGLVETHQHNAAAPPVTKPAPSIPGCVRPGGPRPPAVSPALGNRPGMTSHQPSGLSSAIKIRWDRRGLPAALPLDAPASRVLGPTVGRRTTKVLPRPGPSLVATMLPSCISTRPFTSASPMPSPPRDFSSDRSIRRRSKTSSVPPPTSNASS